MSRREECSQSLGIEHTSCLWKQIFGPHLKKYFIIILDFFNYKLWTKFDTKFIILLVEIGKKRKYDIQCLVWGRPESFNREQCDQIWRFISLWATFQSLWQQLFCPNNHVMVIFVWLSKSFIFLVKSFLGNFYSHWATFYLSHWLEHCMCSR